LDGAMSSIRILPEIVDAVKGDIEIMIDSGIRSGQDVLKAIALGADHTMIGRAFVYGLGAMGQAGVTQALEVIHKELDTTLALCGGKTMADLNRDTLYIQGFQPQRCLSIGLHGLLFLKYPRRRHNSTPNRAIRAIYRFT